MRILSITAQKPHSTGSGVYLTETVRGFKELGHTQAVIAGSFLREWSFTRFTITARSCHFRYAECRTRCRMKAHGTGI